MSLYVPSQGTALDAVAAVEKKDHRMLAEDVVSDTLNRLIANDNGGPFEDGCPIPYAGWYWRDVDFFRPQGVTVASTGAGVVVCQNNKWDYESRDLTDDEQVTFRDLVWDAWLASRQGGILADINAATSAALGKAGAFIRGLEVSA